MGDNNNNNIIIILYFRREGTKYILSIVKRKKIGINCITP